MKTKSNVRFFSRAAHLDTDIEMADVIEKSIRTGLLHNQTSQYIFSVVNQQSHPKLSNRAATTQSRKLAAIHLKSTLCEAYIKNIYEDATQYIREIIGAAARNGLDPNRLIGEHKVTFEANDVLKAGSWSAIVEMVAESVFRKLENERNTRALFEKTSSKLGLGVSTAIINAALPFFEVRHLLVHSDGKADKKFCDSFPSFGATSGHKIKLDYVLINNARAAIFNLITEFDKKIVSKQAVHSSELQP